MIISKTPFRISFFGGGSDLPQWYKKFGGSVISTTIDKYCYISLRELPPFFQHKHRIVYSKVENIIKIKDIKHPAVRAIFTKYKVKNGLEMHHDGDLPARSGLGTSSSFCVGLINSLYALNKKFISQTELANEAIDVEQKLLKETVGVQDQIAAAFGGFNRINIFKDGTFEIEPITISLQRLNLLQNNLLLFFTGISRYSSDISKDFVLNNSKNISNISKIISFVDEAQSILVNQKMNLDDFGLLLNESWMIKKQLSERISNEYIDEIYSKAINAGALGGKILGAGGGGFILFYANQSQHKKIRSVLKSLVEVPFMFENSGSNIVLNNPSGF